MNLPSRGQLGQLVLSTAALSVGCRVARSTIPASSRPRGRLLFAATSLASSNVDAAVCMPATTSRRCPGCPICKPTPWQKFVALLKAVAGSAQVWLAAFGVSAVFLVRAVWTLETLGTQKTGLDNVDQVVSTVSKLGREGLVMIAGLGVGFLGYFDVKLDKMDGKLDKLLETQQVLLTDKAIRDYERAITKRK